MPEGQEILSLAQSYVVLDVRAQSVEFRRNLNTSVHDALWALSMQWRLKEFQGEDTGSLIYSKVNTEKTKMTRFQPFAGVVEAFDSAIPLETQVEREYIQYDLALHLQLGRYWRKLLIKHNIESHYNLFIQAFPVEDASNYQQLSNENAVQVRKTSQGRALAGGGLLNYLLSNPGLTASDLADHVETAQQSIPSSLFSNLEDAMSEFLAFYSRLFSQPENDSCWNKNRLEYSFKSSVSDNSSGDQTVFESEEYHGGRLDWYNFDIKPGASNSLEEGAGVTIDDNVQESEKLSVIPMTVSFPGMPLDRWWQMQHGNINYAAIKPSKTGLLGMIVKDFLINYNNDWSLIPYDVPLGTYSKIRSIVVRDVFGDDIYVGGELPPPPDTPLGDDKWSVYKLNKTNDFYDWDVRLFIPPVLPQIIEGENLDVVNLFRDQMANMAWAVETQVPDELGGFKNGTDAEVELKKYLQSIYPDKDPTEAPTPPLETGGEYRKPSLKYTAITYVPENWIPLIPQHQTGSTTKIDLQRATLPRVMENKDIDYSIAGNYVSPRTKVMREGLDNSTPRTYKIRDEEVPRSGIYVSRSFQRCRWHNGKVFLWMGRRKRTGRGEGLSGLVFDNVTSEQQL